MMIDIRHKSISEIFAEIAELENGVYSNQEQMFFGEGMSKLPVTFQKLEVYYEGSKIEMNFEFGNHNMGYIDCILKKVHRIPKFSISSNSHFWRLFNKKSNILTVKCKDPVFRNLLEKDLEKYDLEKIAREVLFEPKVYLSEENGITKLRAEVYLAFRDKEKIIQPMLNLFKSILAFNKRKRGISH